MNRQIRENGKRLTGFGLSALVIVALWSTTLPAAYAQGPGHDRTLDYLDQTDQIIDKAKKAVDESGSERARALLQNAVALQEQAWEQYRGKMYGQAEKQTARAREKAFEAIAATRSPEENENAVARQLERTDEILEGIQSRMDELRGRGRGSGAQTADSQFESLMHRQQLAWQQYHERRLRSALKVTLQVREQAARITEQARRFRHGWTDIEQSLERMGEFLDRARSLVMESDRAKNIETFRRAERRYTQAQQAFQAGQMSRAQEHLRICRELMDRSLAGIEQTTDPDQVDELIKQAQRKWEQLEAPIIESGNQGLRDMHRQAGEHLEQAKNQLRQEMIVQALTHVRAAIGLLNQADETLP